MRVRPSTPLAEPPASAPQRRRRLSGAPQGPTRRNERKPYAAGAASASKMRFAPGSSPSDSAR
jgi:hypothetical protein